MFQIKKKDGTILEVPSSFNEYVVKKKMGNGTFGDVFKIEQKDSQKIFAAKISPIKINNNENKQNENAINEYEILKLINHPNIIKFYDAFEIECKENEKLFVIILEYCSNGSMLEYVNNRKFKNKTEKKKMMKDIITAVFFLHEMNIAHCDLKLENIMIDENFNIKLIDFGLSKNFSGKYNKRIVGSPAYAAPELFINKKKVDFFKADIWSLGVVLYAMSERKLPYKNIHETLKIDFEIKMKNKKLKKVIKKCFNVNQNTRPNTNYLLNSNYFKGT